MGEGDELQRSLDLMVERAQNLIDGPEEAGPEMDEYWPSSWPEARGIRLEFIESPEELTIILDGPRFDPRDVIIELTEASIYVHSGRFRMKKDLPCRVIPRTRKDAFSNGVMSLIIFKSV